MSRALRIAALAVAVLAASAVARGEPSSRAAAEARRHLERGNALYQHGRYDDAIRELLAGYGVDPRPDFLYALGQAERKRGDCKAAIGYYQRYVDSGQSPQRTVAVLVQIDRCKQELAAAPVTPPSKPPAATSEPATPPSDAPPETTPPASATAAAPPEAAAPAPLAAAPVEPAAHASRDARPVYKRWWLWTIVGVAAAGAAVGLGVGLTQQRSFNSTLPDLVAGNAAVRF